MPTARPDSYVIASGADLYAGIAAPSPPPPPPPPPPAPGLLRLVQGDTTKTVGVATSGWGVQNDGGQAAVAVVAVTPGTDATIGTNNFSVAAGAFAAFALTGLVSGSKSVSLTTSTSGASVDGTSTPKSISFTSAPSPTPPPAPAPSPVSAPGGFSLSSSTSGTIPFTAGMAFQPGAIPSGSGVAVAGATAQATVKSTWPDGSAKLIIVAGTYPSTGSAVAVTPSAGTALAGSALTTTNLKAALTQPVAITGATLGSASWSGTDWDSPFETWVSGPAMSSWVYRKAVGSDPHVVAWLEVRLYASGAVEVLPWIENGYLMVSGPTSKADTWQFIMGGTARLGGGLTIDLPSHCRTPLISGTATAHWQGISDPDVVVRHDGDYLQSTGLVPAYTAQVADGSARIAALPTSYTPLQQGSWPNVMGSGGYSPSIGLLPEWEVLYLTNGSAPTYKGVIFNAFSAGRYAFHFRDESDGNRWTRLSQHTTLQIRDPQSGYVTPPLVTGTAAPAFSVSHQPSIGFLAYLITGRRYFLDELQAAESHNSMADPASVRGNGNGICDSAQAGTIRRVAWTLRTCAQAISATPDSDTTMLTEYRTRYGNNVDWYHNKYVVTAPNAFGIVKPYEGPGAYGNSSVSGTIWLGSMWMQDFLTASFGYAKDLGLNLGSTTSTKLDAFFAWKAQSIVGRLAAAGDATGSPYYGFAPYNWALCPASANFDTGTGFYSTWRAAFNATYSGSETNATANNGPYTSLGADVDKPIQTYLGYDFQVAEAQPALAYAVKHGVTGAAAAEARLWAAGNFVDLQSAFDTNPVWAVTSAARPKWLRGLAKDTWKELTGSRMYGDYPGSSNTARDTDGGSSSGLPWLDSYNGMGADTDKNAVYQVANGGHGDYFGNEVIKLDLMADTPGWLEWQKGSTGNVVQTFAYAVANYPDQQFDAQRARYLDDGVNGRMPASAHSYWATQYIARHRRMWRGPGCSYSPSGTAFKDCEGWALDGSRYAARWDVQYTYPGTFAGGYTAGVQGATSIIRPTTCRDPRTDKLYVMSVGGNRIFTPSTTGPTGSANSGGSWATLTSGGHTQGASAVDTKRGKLVTLNGTTADLGIYDIDGSAGWTVSTMTGTAAATIAASPASDGWGMVYVPALDAFLVKRGTTDGAEIFKVDAATYAVTVYAPTGGASVPQSNFIASNNANVYNRWQYLPKLRGVVYAPKNAANVWFLRTH